MSIVVLGLNHANAPLEIRERLAFDASKVPDALAELKGMDARAEFAILSTCNRVEVYCVSENKPQAVIRRMAEFLSRFHGVPSDDFRPYLHALVDEEAVRHLLKVASGLDSMVVGESQVLGQVKESYRLACAAGTTGRTLNRLFHGAFFTAKRIHATTGISTGRVSVAGVAVELAVQLFADLSRAKVVVVGAGDTGELVVQHLVKRGCTDVTVVNRSYERGLGLARRQRVAAERWEELGAQIGRADIIISSAATQDYLFTKEAFERSVAGQDGGETLIVDVGVPRNFEPCINEIPNVYLYSIDELKEVAEQNLKAREEDVSKCLEIIYDSAAEFMEWFHARDIGPLIGRMKSRFMQIGQNELERFFVGPRQEASCRLVMEETVNRVVNKLLHCVISNVNSVAKETGPTEAAKLVDTILQQAREIASESPTKERMEG